jgi:predicted TIM-barrel fold metal-dependent hydrolase
MRVVDGHVHLVGEASDEYAAAVLRAMDRNSVAQAVVFGLQGDVECPDSLARCAHENHAERFVPFTCELDSEGASLAETVDRRLAQGPWRGLGEIFLATSDPTMDYLTREGSPRQFRYPVPSEGPLSSRWAEVFEVCATHHAPALIHYDIAPPDEGKALGTLLARHPNTTFIWAHADWDAVLAERLWGSQPNRIVEIGAHLHFAVLDEPKHVADWLAYWVPLLERFAGRITFGSDYFEWRHLEPEEHADAAYEGIAQVCERLAPEAAAAWLSGALDQVLATPRAS